ncbi:lactonase family protein [Acidicapsa ligni]|uniref:lactonase family protein n=1 Tax=Acidicapsa ligni TaxID=542300 RepID=UPI0021E0CCDB|nr:lactonase family protein [Acidicapsa ligni]
MANLTRRNFVRHSVLGSAALSLTMKSGLLAAQPSTHASKRILVGSGGEGILSFRWDAATGNLEPEGIAGVVSHSTWIDVSPDKRYLYVACELDEYQGKRTGAIASFKLPANQGEGKLSQISIVPSVGAGTCHLTTDHSGHVVIAADYSGGSAGTYLTTDGKLSNAVVSEHYTGYPGHGPVADRQEQAHAHFASVSPDNRFAYINDLGSDVIHIYKLDPLTAQLTPAGTFHAQPGVGPRTLHFLTGDGPVNGKIAYCVNELNSTVTVLKWNTTDGSLSPIQVVSLLTANDKPPAGVTNTGCDAVLTRDGRFAYFANRGEDFIIGFHVDQATGKLTEFSRNSRIPSGGKTPRNFTLDPTERWMLVANQGSSNLSVFARNPKTGELSAQGKNTPAKVPMCIVFI